MTSEGLGEMFEGDSADTCTRKFQLMLMGGLAEGLACADPGTQHEWKFLILFVVLFRYPDSAICCDNCI